MKIISLLISIILVGCSTPNSPTTNVTTTTTITTHIAIVKNSLWQTVKTYTLDSTARSATNPTYAEIQAIVDADNALSLTSQEWVYLDTAPDIANAPNGNVFYVRRDNGIPVHSILNLTRQYIFDNYQNFINDANISWGGDVVYIDHIPPAPILAKDTTPYEWYSIYVIEDAPVSGTILYEDHGGYNSDETWSGQWITTPIGQFYNGTPGGGWATVDAYYNSMIIAWSPSIVRPQDQWPGVTAAHFVTRELYPPLPAPVVQ